MVLVVKYSVFKYSLIFTNLTNDVIFIQGLGHPCIKGKFPRGGGGGEEKVFANFLVIYLLIFKLY